jgi:hypothetical protein
LIAHADSSANSNGELLKETGSTNAEISAAKSHPAPSKDNELEMAREEAGGLPG